MIRLAVELDIFYSYYKKESRLSSNIIINIAYNIDKRANKEIIIRSPWDFFRFKIPPGTSPFFAFDN